MDYQIWKKRVSWITSSKLYGKIILGIFQYIFKPSTYTCLLFFLVAILKKPQSLWSLVNIFDTERSYKEMGENRTSYSTSCWALTYSTTLPDSSYISNACYMNESLLISQSIKIHSLNIKQLLILFSGDELVTHQRRS